MWPFRFVMRKKRGLPHMVVYLLSSSPKNGVELMDGVESITRGWWRPTPGSIYPLLKEMSGQGTVRKLVDGRYELTPKGRAQAEGTFGRPRRRPRSTGEMLDRMNAYASYMEDARGTPADQLPAYRDKLEELARRIERLRGKDRVGQDSP